MWTETVLNIEEATVMRVGVLVRVLIELLADTTPVIVTGIFVDVVTNVNVKMLASTTTDLEFIAMAVSLAESLCFC